MAQEEPDEEDIRFNRYLLEYHKGFWFASCLEMEIWAERKVKEGVLKPLSTLIPDKPKMTKYWYILASVTKTEELLKYFSMNALNAFGIHEHNLEYYI